MIICIILSSLALAAALVCTAVTVRERKRSRERNAAQLDEMKREFSVQIKKLDAHWIEQTKRRDAAWEKVAREIQGRIDDLENGAVPDYEKAKAAAKAVDDFHEGLANILNFDPYDSARKNRDEGGGEAL